MIYRFNRFFIRDLLIRFIRRNFQVMVNRFVYCFSLKMYLHPLKTLLHDRFYLLKSRINECYYYKNALRTLFWHSIIWKFVLILPSWDFILIVWYFSLQTNSLHSLIRSVKDWLYLKISSLTLPLTYWKGAQRFHSLTTVT